MGDDADADTEWAELERAAVAFRDSTTPRPLALAPAADAAADAAVAPDSRTPRTPRTPRTRRAQVVPLACEPEDEGAVGAAAPPPPQAAAVAPADVAADEAPASARARPELTRLPITWEGALSRGLASLAAAITPRSARGADAAAAAPAAPAAPAPAALRSGSGDADAALHVARDKLFTHTLLQRDRGGAADMSAARSASLAAAAARERKWVLRLLALRDTSLGAAAADALRALLVAAWLLTGAAIVFAALWRVDDQSGRIVLAT